LDRRLVAALGATPAVACRPYGARRRNSSKSGWSALTLSGIVHVVVLILLSAFVFPIDLGEVAALVAEMPAAEEEPPLERLAATIDASLDEPLDVAALPTQVECPDPLELFTFADPQLADSLLVEPLGPPIKELPPADELMQQLAPGEFDGSLLPSLGELARQGEKAGEGVAEYFGTVATGNRFVYVVDRSNSMDGARFNRAVAELLRSLDRLQPDQSFYVVLFSDDMRRMFDEHGTEPEMRAATAENKDRLRGWLAGVATGGGTHPKKAIRFALSLRPSAVFVLSDGEFSGISGAAGGDLLAAGSPMRDLVGRSGSGGVPIHSFAYEDPSSMANMQALAALTGGNFRYLAPAGAAGDAVAVPPVAVAPPQGPVGPPQPSLPQQQQAGLLLSQADSLRDAGDYREALRLYRELVAQSPTTPAGEAARGRILRLYQATSIFWGGQGGMR